MALSSCLASLMVIVLISLSTVVADYKTCQVCGDPHFEGWQPEMNGSVPYPCNFVMLSTSRFEMKDGDSVRLNIFAHSAMATLNGRYYVDVVRVHISILPAGSTIYANIVYEISVGLIEKAMAGEKADPWKDLATQLPPEYSDKVVTNFSSTANTGTAKLHVYNPQGQVVLALHFHKYQTWTCLKTKVDSSVQPPAMYQFPGTLCSTFTDTTWGSMDTTGLTTQQILLLGLLKQSINNDDPDCSGVTDLIKWTCLSDAARKHALQACDHFLNPDEAQCMEDSAKGGNSGDAFRAFHLCVKAQKDCGNEATTFYQELFTRGCQ